MPADRFIQLAGAAHHAYCCIMSPVQHLRYVVQERREAGEEGTEVGQRERTTMHNAARANQAGQVVAVSYASPSATRARAGLSFSLSVVRNA